MRLILLGSRFLSLDSAYIVHIFNYSDYGMLNWMHTGKHPGQPGEACQDRRPSQGHMSAQENTQ